MRSVTCSLRGRDGMALVIVLLAVAVLTASVVEFVSGVQRATDRLYNWERLQRLSLAADSGISVAAVGIKIKSEGKSYTWPGTLAIPPRDAFKDGSFVSVLIEDETGKFNINKVVSENGSVDGKRLEQLRRLLRHLDLDAAVADRIVDWTDPDSIGLLADSEVRAKNAPLTSVEEILQVPGISRPVYDKLIPHVTVHGSGLVNVNSAGVPVLVALYEDMSPELAQRVVEHRTEKAFEQVGSLSEAVGGTLALKLSLWTTVRSNAFLVTTTAISGDGLTRTIQAVLDIDRNVTYWKEN